MSFDPKSMSVASTTQATMSSVTQAQATSSQEGQLSNHTVQILLTSDETEDDEQLIGQVSQETFSNMTETMVQNLCSLVDIDETAPQKDEPVLKLVPARLAKFTAAVDKVDEDALKKDFSDGEKYYLNFFSASLVKDLTNLDVLCPPLAPFLKPEMNAVRMKKFFTFHLVGAMKVYCEKVSKISQNYFKVIPSKFEKKKKVILNLGEATFEQEQKIRNFPKEELEEILDKIHPKSVDELDPNRFSKDHLVIAKEVMSALQEALHKDPEMGEVFLRGMKKIISVDIEEKTKEEKEAAVAKK